MTQPSGDWARSIFDAAWLGTQADPWVLLLAALMGAAMGLTGCALSCLPVLGGLALGQAGQTTFWRWYGVFSLGRMCAYAGLATVAAVFSHTTARALGQELSQWLTPTLYAIAAAFFALHAVRSWRQRHRASSSLRALEPHAPRSRPGLLGQQQRHTPFWASQQIPVRFFRTPPSRTPGTRCLSRWSHTPAFMSGVALSLVPCPALAALLVYAASIHDWLWAIFAAAAFALGAALTPAAIFAYGANRLRPQIPPYWGDALAAVLFALLAIAR